MEIIVLLKYLSKNLARNRFKNNFVGLSKLLRRCLNIDDNAVKIFNTFAKFECFT